MTISGEQEVDELTNETTGNTARECELEALVVELLETQVAIKDSVSTTSQFLRLALSIANENLGFVNSLLSRVKVLADQIDTFDS